MSTRWIAASFAVMLAAMVSIGVGCNTDDDIPQGTATTFYGITADASNVPGTIELSGVAYPQTMVASLRGIPAPGPNAVALTGTLTFPGQTALTLTGYYDPDTYAIVFGSDTPFYSFVGTVAGTSATGFSNGPNGQGSFVLVVNGTAASSTTYCGTAVCDTPVGCTDTATFNLVVSGSTALMTITANGESAFGVGTATASSVTFHVVFETAIDLNIDGTITGSSVSGTWVDNTPSAQAGTWSGDTATCTTAPGLRKR